MTSNAPGSGPAAPALAASVVWPGSSNRSRPAGAGNADVWVVVAAFNEARMIGRRRSRAPYHLPQRGCGRRRLHGRHRREALAAGAVVVSHAFNLGQGAALQTGLEYALARGAAYVATFDADGQHHAADLAHMIATLRSEPVDIVLGSRFPRTHREHAVVPSPSPARRGTPVQADDWRHIDGRP